MLGEPFQRSFVMSIAVSSHAVDEFVPANISNDFITVIGRVLIAAIFLLSRLSKLAAPSYTVGYIASAGLLFPCVGYAIAVALEIGGSLALLRVTRPALRLRYLRSRSPQRARIPQPLRRPESVHPFL
jgi:hypothetical protein